MEIVAFRLAVDRTGTLAQRGANGQLAVYPLSLSSAFAGLYRSLT